MEKSVHFSVVTTSGIDKRECMRVLHLDFQKFFNKVSHKRLAKLVYTRLWVRPPTMNLNALMIRGSGEILLTQIFYTKLTDNFGKRFRRQIICWTLLQDEVKPGVKIFYSKVQ